MGFASNRVNPMNNAPTRPATPPKTRKLQYIKTIFHNIPIAPGLSAPGMRFIAQGKGSSKYNNFPVLRSNVVCLQGAAKGA